MTVPPRGFSVAEFRGRTERAQHLMAAEDLDALLLTTAPEVRYFSGFLTRFWESPTRPWFLIVPAFGQANRGDPGHRRRSDVQDVARRRPNVERTAPGWMMACPSWRTTLREVSARPWADRRTDGA